MFRWIAYFSTQPILVADVILRPEHAIVKQIDEHYLPGIQAPASDGGGPNSFTNVDGFGIGWYSSVPNRYRIHDTPREQYPHPPLEPVVYRNILPPIHDLNLHGLANAIESSTVFGHVRATVGSPVAVANCHPFRAGRLLFMHNGAVGGFIDAQVRILSRLSHSARLTIQGNTDSEHVFALFFTYLDPHGPWMRDYRPQELEDALEHTVSTLITACEPARGWLEGDGRTVRSWLSLNVAVTDGSSFLALRFAHPPEREPPSLYYSSVGGSALDRRYCSHPDGGPDVGDRPRTEHEPHVVVASEPMTRAKGDDWTLMRPGDLLTTSHAELDLVSRHRVQQHRRGTAINKGWFEPRVRPLFLDHDILSPKHASRVVAQPAPVSSSHGTPALVRRARRDSVAQVYADPRLARSPQEHARRRRPVSTSGSDRSTLS
ncbi:uncharacterized protein RHOBADRAFT_55781 [Rhodotorula graminis WP1]|uniref:Glutamine amidotransferase type-2 domain-containing protein n=1 Tax=Rhodotorula graminis (strain WP1) TaxID=578459 RepID=A0A0P9GZ77_RHOGW|nr:uncharacterized protein RHOBADRAFT_55781 [Rhodotorula graminis WP1]KPV72703.1 hypothetical protein RHOBADRAFT_55781 [Rhodotorula graminis WP1]